MSKLKKNEKKTLLHKLLEFKLAGTVSYAKYLATQLESSEGVAIRKAYTRYIKKEIASTAKKIARLESKLKKSKPKAVKLEKAAIVSKPVVAAKPAAVKTPRTAAKPAAKPAVAVKPKATSKPVVPSKASVGLKPRTTAKPKAAPKPVAAKVVKPK